MVAWSYKSSDLSKDLFTPSFFFFFKQILFKKKISTSDCKYNWLTNDIHALFLIYRANTAAAQCAHWWYLSLLTSVLELHTPF